MNIYEINSQGIYTGNARKITLLEGRPKGWVRSDMPPPIAEGKVARWEGGKWQLVNPPEPASELEKSPAMLTVLQLRRLFTFAEKVALEQAITEGNAAVKVFMDDLAAAEYIDLTDPLVIEGVQFLVQQEFLTQERADQVLANEGPDD